MAQRIPGTSTQSGVERRGVQASDAIATAIREMVNGTGIPKPKLSPNAQPISLPFGRMVYVDQGTVYQHVAGTGMVGDRYGPTEYWLRRGSLDAGPQASVQPVGASVSNRRHSNRNSGKPVRTGHSARRSR
jgi:hypothetical protein